MILYRTVDITELISVMCGNVILGKEQKSCNCYEIINEELVSMQKLKKSCLCGFAEPLFYNGYKSENIMLKLDIQDDQICNGYGDYFSPLYNDYIDGDPWIINSEFGPNAKFRGIIQTRVPELHFLQYNISNVLEVFFPYHVKVCTELGYVEKCNETPFDFCAFIYKYFSKISRGTSYAMSSNIRYLRHLEHEFSISMAKKIIKNELNNTKKTCWLPMEDLIRVVDNFKFFVGEDFSARLDNPHTLTIVKRGLDYGSLARLLRDVFEESVFTSGLEIRDLPNCDETNEKFLGFYKEFLEEAKNVQDAFPLIIKNENEVKNMFYAMCLDIGIV